MNGSPVGRFSKERQAIGEGLGRLLEKMDSELDFGTWYAVDGSWLEAAYSGVKRTDFGC